jgi:hypothetical protein
MDHVHLRTVAVVCLVAAVAFSARDDAGAAIVRAIDQAQVDREARLAGYTVTEHYLLRNSRFQDPAEMTVETTYVRGAGKTYHVVSETGPSMLQTHVLDRMLKEEAAMSKGEQRKKALVISANYDLKVIGQETLGGRNCDLVELNPRAKSPHLLKGKAWLDAGTHVLVRIEGRPTASPSFLAGKPEVIRDYTEIEGFSLAEKSHAISDSFLLGKTDLTIEYTNYRVNGAGSK